MTVLSWAAAAVISVAPLLGWRTGMRRTLRKDCRSFSPRHLFSRGSVATRLRCGGIFSDYFITRLLLSQTVKIFENRSTFGKVRVSCFYFDSQGIEMLGELLLVFLVL